LYFNGEKNDDPIFRRLAIFGSMMFHHKYLKEYPGCDSTNISRKMWIPSEDQHKEMESSSITMASSSRLAKEDFVNGLAETAGCGL
jgi:hypothetical protein